MSADTIVQAAADLGLTLESQFVPWSASRNNNRKEPSLNWKVTVKKDGRAVLTTDYSAGMAHCPSYKHGRLTVDDYTTIKRECETGRRRYGVRGVDGDPILPKTADVFACFMIDAEAIDSPTFTEWAHTACYDPDSRSAEAIYRTCLEIALALRAAVGDDGLKKLRAACENY